MVIQKNKYITTYLIVFFIFCSNLIIADNDHLQQYYDQSEVEVRLPDSDDIDDLKSKPAFQYDTEPKPPETFWDKILYKLGKIIDWIFNGSPVGAFIAWSVISIIILLIILRLLRTPLKNLFVGSKYDKDITIQEIDEEAPEEEIDKKIQDCLTNKRYRLATRLLYIKLLKRLSFHEIIKWEINKTNKDYRIELLETKYKEIFNKLSSLYDYIWYGNFKIEEEQFTNVYNQYNTFFKELDEE